MVDRNQIKKLLKMHFRITGTIVIDDQGVVNVHPLWSDDYQEDAKVVMKPSSPKIPVQFGLVEGSFIANNVGLTSLEGAPHTVRGEFSAKSNQLTSLKHGPSHVELYYRVNRNPLNSLEGFPEHLGKEFAFSYSDHLPLLRCLTAPGIWPEPDQVELERIFHKYAGQGKKVMLNCALELKAHGFAGNARW